MDTTVPICATAVRRMMHIIMSQIQTMHEACSPDRPSCMKNCGIAMYMVDVSTRPTTSFTYIVTRCNTDDNEVKVLQCQSAQPDSLQYPVTSSADMSAYYVSTSKPQIYV